MPAAPLTAHPHFAQVPVVVVRLVLVGELPAEDDAVLPTLRFEKDRKREKKCQNKP